MEQLDEHFQAAVTAMSAYCQDLDEELFAGELGHARQQGEESLSDVEVDWQACPSEEHQGVGHLEAKHHSVVVVAIGPEHMGLQLAAIDIGCSVRKASVGSISVSLVPVETRTFSCPAERVFDQVSLSTQILYPLYHL